MKTLVSFSARTIVREGADTDSMEGISFDGEVRSPRHTFNLIAIAPDWEEYEVGANGQLTAEFFAEERAARAHHYIEQVLLGLPAPLTRAVLTRVEEILSEGTGARTVLKRVLLAPLRSSTRIEEAKVLALGSGLAATAGLLAEIQDHQPLLNRFATAWLRLPEQVFGPVGRPRQFVWQELASTGVTLRLLMAEDGTEFLRAWGPFALRSGPAAPAMHEIGKSLLRELMPDSRPFAPALEDLSVDSWDGQPERRATRRKTEAGAHKKERARKQIEAILLAVAEGRDDRASRYLGQLVESQSGEEEREYAVKSLCNVAQRCADMFRSDFERTCLDEARRLLPDDPWLLIQLADHLKRTGQYDEALEVLRSAAAQGVVIALSLSADVWTERGDFDRALQEYSRIPNADNDPVVATARADIYRKQGKLDDAWRAYETIVRQRGQGRSRALAGMGAVLLRRGEYEEAVTHLRNAVDDWANDERGRQINRLALCHALKLAEAYTDALEVADSLVREYPFMMTARLAKATINALLGHETAALRDLPEHRQSVGFGEWKQNYIRGLILFRLKRYTDANVLLRSTIELAGTAELPGLVRLAAALSYLRGSQKNIGTLLLPFGEDEEPLLGHVRMVLQLHLATLERDVAQVAQLSKKLAAIRDPQISSILDAFRKKQLSRVAQLEVDLLLRAA